MGREVTEIQVVDKKPNVVTTASNGSPNGKICISTKIAAAKVQEKDHEVKECTEVNTFVEKCHEKKEVYNIDLPEEENEKHEVQKMDDNKKLSSPAVRKEHTSHSVPQPSDLVTEKHGSFAEVVDTEAVAAGLNLSPNSNNMHSPYSSKNSQVIDDLA